MIDISIVSGTYNRLPYMRKMVESIRYSVHPLSYEIVLVDGGSTDGTIRWCASQNDIRLIEQGRLLGAVKAFNEGARSARGRYVILANDDIEFIGRSILRSWTFMEDYRTVGIGCFYQDRDNKRWHVEHMPALTEIGRQISVPYGQVCIVPRQLGNKVGWWGDYLHTYGGDNELSCNVLELGYEVVPIRGTRIHDFSNDLKDELRRINNDDPTRLGGRHPDSEKWTKKWTNKFGKTGPRIMNRPIPVDTSDLADFRILYAPIYEPGNTLQRATKTGLRDALSKRGRVIESDYMVEGLNGLQNKACAMCPDLFVLQIQDASMWRSETIRMMRVDHPDAKFVSWNGDYHPNNLQDITYMQLMREMDHAGFAVASIEEEYRNMGISWFYWQIGYEESGDEDTGINTRHDVTFLGNGYTEERKDLARFLISISQITGFDLGLYGSWPEGWSRSSNLYDFRSGEKIYRGSKIAISDQQWPEATGYVSNRLFQAMAAGGCMVLQQKFDGMNEYLGLVPGKHLATWETLGGLKEQIDYYMSHEDVRRKIAVAGHEFMLAKHSFDVRVQEMLDVLSR